LVLLLLVLFVSFFLVRLADSFEQLFELAVLRPFWVKVARAMKQMKRNDVEKFKYIAGKKKEIPIIN